jgi:hypothetical protein
VPLPGSPPVLLFWPPILNHFNTLNYSIFICEYKALQAYLYPLSFSIPLIPVPKQFGVLHSCSSFGGVLFVCLHLHSAYDCKHAMLVSLSLAYFALRDDLQFHPFSCKWHKSILCGRVILLCVCTYIENIFFMRSSVDEHLGCFHSLATCEYCRYKPECVDVSIVCWLTFLHLSAQQWYSRIIS